MDQLLSVQDLQVAFDTEDGRVIGVQDVSFALKAGETLCIVGESGCGKSVTSLSIMGLLGKHGKVTRGSIEFEGADLASADQATLRAIRGNRISMIFQEPMTSLNPILSVGRQLTEPIELHLGKKGQEARDYAVEWLKKVGIPRPEKVFDDYPGTLSGGMRQRVMIAMAMLCSPALLIADEPTTALDVTIQAQILDLMTELREETGAAVLLITHDLGVVAETADRVAVMYAGQIVEEADVFTLFANPQHPYTKGLLASIPDVSDDFSERLKSIPGSVPSLRDMPEGCRFRDRCSSVQAACKGGEPPLFPAGPGHQARCWLLEGGAK